MGFISVLIAVTLCIAGSAAFFSIHGLAQIFTGAFVPVVIMASSLEAGKLVAASYVYRYWSLISIWMRVYLISAILVLMAITSAGIFGYLSGAYQQDMLSLKQNQQKIEQLEQERQQYKQLKQQALERKDEIDADIASLPNNFITGRQRLLGEKGYGPELQQIKKDVQHYNQQIRQATETITELEGQTMEQRVHTGPIIFIAKVFDKQVDDTTKWLILLIIFAFDPLAVILVVGANVALLHINERRQHSGPTTPDDEPQPSVTTISDLFEGEDIGGLTEDDVRQIIEQYQTQTGIQLTDEHEQQIQQMLREKQIRQQMRTSSQT